ncbi:MAG: hypothetical protein A2504_02305 [Bdellovibrionales bacterium RIFOXYD12_FULL_39_22]|nr:MAG: hypothetical protein A2385_12330 [Bdellovibrionales bacterium RIFOXYB1_FULL_39_21]OFZ41428.1 MAG: hypothetical protein A2485_01500 [Bdellovibrionales bacterium RIFOXYC12_FULL_39_17]OFZ45383.1 MAG: hypothetical protein A2404_13515 [Bdellovibrionales bacterium RIFOXYC1_FULL_39_130]OFZ74579.1 MAG: hypothetical protein A2560_12620 [Bdellovibrionales bacterium RIFOXYD1_FULL_39_84]OFZ92588.1 MAG: hypothetical protein A2504_02305 [Bdellovibrionales bacterium RIFOXYD12_FULL_39_22]HLE09673.1 hy
MKIYIMVISFFVVISVFYSCSNLEKKNSTVISLSDSKSTPKREISSDTEVLTKTSVNGHVFTQVLDYPEMGNAWRDESGLIWGDIAMDDTGQEKSVIQGHAWVYCNEIGAKVPSKEQFAQLVEYLGGKTKNGYRPEIIPNLADHMYWTSSVSNTDDEHYGIRFDANHGILESYLRNDFFSVRCVK